MGRRWQHQVSAEWLLARKDVLTATEIKALVPEMKRLEKKPLKAGEISPAFAALWADKNTSSNIDTDSPSSDAARGHIMEPYAIESYNRQSDDTFYHWDDCIIKTDTGCGFSPDAMNIMQPLGTVELDAWQVSGARKIMEIKSYNPQHHMKCILKKPSDHDELWQIASAFYVLPKLEEAELVFYCPDAPISMHVISYDREDVKDYLPMIEKVIRQYRETAKECEKLVELSCFRSAFTEQEIWKEYIESNYDNLIMR
jgi:hypothetical protein